MQPRHPILVTRHYSETSNVYADHWHALRCALPHAEFVTWNANPPDMRGKRVVKVGNSYFLGSAVFERYAHALRQAAHVYIIHNDYTSPPPTQIRNVVRGIPATLLTTHRDPTSFRTHLKSWNWFDEVQYVDWNRASYASAPYIKPVDPGVVYWGAYRPGRKESFREYLDGPYPVTISITSKV